jgi:hypothetical protein
MMLRVRDLLCVAEQRVMALERGRYLLDFERHFWLPADVEAAHF